MAQIRPSPTLAITARATAMRSSGLDVISFAAGEPDFATPDPICQAATEAMQKGFTKYTPGRGYLDLRDAFAEKLKRENGIEGHDVMVTCGAKHALFDALCAIIEPGDEIIILAPFWMTYADQVVVLGGIPILVHATAESGFVPDPDAIDAAITERTRAIMCCSPNNPTGAVWPTETLRAIGEIAVKRNVWIISDEVYEKLIYDGEHTSMAALAPEIADRTLTIMSCSKTYAMTGWRIGFLAGPKRAIDAMACVQDQISHPTSFAMKGALAALAMDESSLNAMKAEFHARRDLMHGLVTAIPGVQAHLSPGAFYVFADFSPYIAEFGPTDLELAENLLQNAHVAVIPGSVFATPNYLRFSYAASRHDIERGIGRVHDALCLVKP